MSSDKEAGEESGSFRSALQQSLDGIRVGARELGKGFVQGVIEILEHSTLSETQSAHTDTCKNLQSGTV